MAILSLNNVLHLGLVDEDQYDDFLANRKAYFRKYHDRFWWSFNNQKKRRLQFRGEANNEWVEPRSVPGKDVRSLQNFLKERGFMPGARLDGIYGYWTLAAVRLFQEYVRTVEGIADMGIPDGRVFKGTHDHMMRWVEDDLYCHWGPDRTASADDPFSWSGQSPEFKLWLGLLDKVKAHYIRELEASDNTDDDLDLFQLQEVNRFPVRTDTLRIKEWSFDPNKIHLLGLRCFQEQADDERGNDDLFVLLMNGMVFKFWGSTDPKPDFTKDGLEPYLVEGQHRYSFSWHKSFGDQVVKVYKALVPEHRGVLVFRDWSGTDSLNEVDIRKGLLFNEREIKDRENPNNTINIHWTADGANNWSAGCQVISGRSYINDQGKLIDCSKFSSPGYKGVSPVSQPGVTKNRGAYTFLSDFVFAYSRPEENTVLYTLGRDGILEDFAEQELLEILHEQIHNSTVVMGVLNGGEVVHEMVKAMAEN